MYLHSAELRELACREKEFKLFLFSMNAHKPLIDSIVVWCILVVTVLMLHLSL